LALREDTSRVQLRKRTAGNRPGKHLQHTATWPNGRERTSEPIDPMIVHGSTSSTEARQERRATVALRQARTRLGLGRQSHHPAPWRLNGHCTG
jgi:hypothetical protein